MIANILLSFMPAGEQVAFAFFKVDETATMLWLLQDNEVKVAYMHDSFELLNRI